MEILWINIDLWLRLHVAASAAAVEPGNFLDGGNICCSVSGHVLRVVPFSPVHRGSVSTHLTVLFRNAGTSQGVSRKVSGNAGPHAGRAERLGRVEAISWNFQSRSRRPRGGCRGNNGPGHLSCLAALPFAYNGSGGPASSGFLFTPLLSGDTSVPYKGPFVPSLLFLPTFNPLSLLLFCLLFLFLQENKTQRRP